MSEQRIVVERPCKHGIADDLGHFRHEPEDKYGTESWCSGGSRRTVELPDMEKLREAVVQSDAGELLGSDLAALTAAARWVLSLESE